MHTEDLELLPAGVEVSLLDLEVPVDAEAAAARFLTPRERAEYQGLRHPLRRREWLGARVCLKSMLVARDCLSDPAECEVRKDRSGRPHLAFTAGLPRGPVHDCSLSHKGRFACACTSSVPGARVGVDIEPISPRLTGLAPAFVNVDDRIDTAGSHEFRLTVLWCLKEAYSKALGLGLGVGLGEVVCRQGPGGEHVVQVRGGPELRARHLAHRGYVIAVCSGRVPRSFERPSRSRLPGGT